MPAAEPHTECHFSPEVPGGLTRQGKWLHPKLQHKMCNQGVYLHISHSTYACLQISEACHESSKEGSASPQGTTHSD